CIPPVPRPENSTQFFFNRIGTDGSASGHYVQELVWDVNDFPRLLAAQVALDRFARKGDPGVAFLSRACGDLQAVGDLAVDLYHDSDGLVARELFGKFWPRLQID